MFTDAPAASSASRSAALSANVRGVVLLAPVVEPAAPELHAHQRSRGLVLAQRRETLGDAGAERPGLVQALVRAVLEHVRNGLVDLGQGHRDPGIPREADELGEVGLVGAVRAVLVLDLHQDDRAALVDLPRDEDLVHAVEVFGHASRYRGSELRSFIVGSAVSQVGQAAVVPLGAHVGAGAHDRVQALLGDQIEEAAEVDALRPATTGRARARARSTRRTSRSRSDPSGGPCGCGRATGRGARAGSAWLLR